MKTAQHLTLQSSLLVHTGFDHVLMTSVYSVQAQLRASTTGRKIPKPSGAVSTGSGGADKSPSALHTVEGPLLGSDEQAGMKDASRYSLDTDRNDDDSENALDGGDTIIMICMESYELMKLEISMASGIS